MIFRFQVAIKVATDEVSITDLVHEAKTMVRIAKNENIVNLQGIALHEETFFVILEYCALGSVENYLSENARHYVQEIEKKNYGFLLTCCTHVAEGMAFLVDKKVIHGDLAARNALITSDMVVKVADFGLSHRLYMQQNQTKEPEKLTVPVASAIEVIRAGHSILEFSDIWSYGIYMWEVFQLGLAVPYTDKYSEYHLTKMGLN